MRLVLDSQQPRIILTVANDIQNGGHLVFTAQDNNFHMGIETPGNAAAEESRQLRSPSKHPGWFQGMGRVSFIRIQPRKPAVQIGAALDAGRKQAEYVDPVAKIRHKFTTATQIYVWSKWETSSGYAVVTRGCASSSSWSTPIRLKIAESPTTTPFISRVDSFPSGASRNLTSVCSARSGTTRFSSAASLITLTHHFDVGVEVVCRSRHALKRGSVHALVVENINYGATTSYLEKQNGDITIRLTNLEKQNIEHSVKLAAMANQFTDLDKKIDTQIERFDKRFDSFQTQMYLAVMAVIATTLGGNFMSSSVPVMEHPPVVTTAPYKDQMKLVNKVFNGYKVGYHDNLTADTSQGQEAELVIKKMTKPSDDNGNRPGFLVDRQRLNVSLSRAFLWAVDMKVDKGWA
ncbi:hypothetical protein V8E54_009055 [Elaphomyces granulatus]